VARKTELNQGRVAYSLTPQLYINFELDDPAVADGLIMRRLGVRTPPITRCSPLRLRGAIVAIAIGRFLNHRLRGQAIFREVYVRLIVIGVVLALQTFRNET